MLIYNATRLMKLAASHLNEGFLHKGTVADDNSTLMEDPG